MCTSIVGNFIASIHSYSPLWLVLQEKKQNLTRNKHYDAFVCYCYEGQDTDFTPKIVPIELEEEHGLKLCVHRRDIKWNIMNAIRNSNSAIIIMSQDYINSLWCVEEFEDCYMENMKDPAFKLFVIYVTGLPFLPLCTRSVAKALRP